MKYKIDGGNFPYVDVLLDRGESVYTDSGAMIWMDNQITMDSNLTGGLFGGIKRAATGESMFLINYTSQADNQGIGFATKIPGEIFPLTLNGSMEYIIQKGAFLFAEPTVKLNLHTNKKIGTGLFSGEGFFLQKLTGHGTVFLEVDGALKEITLDVGQMIKVDTGNVFMYESTVNMNIESIKGFKNMLFGGEGLFITILTGPGKVYLQSMPIRNIAQSLMSYMPRNSN